MRLIVFSDSHGSVRYMRQALELHPEADVVVHLGDGERDFETLCDLLDGKRVIQVCGNCDLCSQLNVEERVILGGAKVLCTHGHFMHVKYGEQMLREVARNWGARIVLYGHTHNCVNKYDDGLYIFNPGSVRDGCYGIVDIVPSGIMCTSHRL